MINNLNIPNPCQQNWNGMIPQESGRFCGSCQKTVIDFTNKTDQEIIDYFTANSGKRTCGKFKTSQLDQVPKISYQKNQYTLKFVAALLLVFGLSLFSCNTEDTHSKQFQEQAQTETMGLPAVPDSVYLKDSLKTNCAGTKTAGLHSQKTDTVAEDLTTTIGEVIPSKNDREDGRTDVVMFADQMPEFPGGSGAMMKYISANFKYPEIAREMAPAGTIYVRFIVEKDGSIDEVKLLRGIGMGFDEEAIRVVKSMPKWTPGMNKGKKVNVQYNLPIKIRLQ